MKNYSFIILFFILVLLCSSCSPSSLSGQTDIRSNSPIEQSSVIKETKSTESAQSTLTDETTKLYSEAEDASSTHRELLKRLYEEMPILTSLVFTVDFKEEYTKAYLALLAKLGMTYNGQLESFVGLETVNRIDPFSEKIIPTEAIETIEIDEYYGIILDNFSFPNYGSWWSENMDTLVMHSFWFLDNGQLLRIISQGTLEKNNYVSQTTSWKSPDLSNAYYNFRVCQYDIISVDEFLGLKEYYLSKQGVEDNWQRPSSSEIGWVQGEEWPEIFVTKYGIE